MPEKIENLKETIVDTVDDHSEEVMIVGYGLLCIAVVVVSTAVSIKLTKWQAKMIGREVAKSLR